MKKIKLFIIPALLIILFSLTGCKKKSTKSDMEIFLENITDSGNSFTSYVEEDTIERNQEQLYYKHIKFEIDRGEPIKTRYEKKEKRFDQATEQLTSYHTIGDKKYNANQTESAYEIPNYWLSFAFNQDFLQEGYQLERDDSKVQLQAKIVEDKVSHFFVLEDLQISNLAITIIVEDERLTRFEANFTSKNGFDEKMVVTYRYDSITIE